MKTSNDFSVMLVKFINNLDLPLKIRLDYFIEEDDLVVNPTAGGKVDTLYMDGTKEISLPFEIAVKSKRNELANDILWKIHDSLSDWDLNIKSENDSYHFLSLQVEKPQVNGRDSQNFFIYSMGIVARLEIKEKK